MTKIQIELSKAEDKIVSIYKIHHELKTKQKAINEIITKFIDPISQQEEDSLKD
jgi:flavoprotein